MKAQPGDMLVVESMREGQPSRRGRIVEVQHADGSPPYLVRWGESDHEALVFPGPDSRIEHANVAQEGHV
jgi:Domain of unknown function (DUF1918)